MSSRNQQQDVTLVSRELLTTLLRQRAGTRADLVGFVKNEPILAEYLQAQVLQIVGKLALGGIPKGTLHGVATEMHMVVDNAAAALRAGYAELLEGLLPADPPGADPEEAPDLNF